MPCKAEEKYNRDTAKAEPPLCLLYYHLSVLICYKSVSFRCFLYIKISNVYAVSRVICTYAVKIQNADAESRSAACTLIHCKTAW